MSTQLDVPARVDMTMRSAQTAKKYMGNPFWVFAAFVKKIQGISVAFLPFLPFFGLYFGILSSAQNMGAWGYGANGIVFWVGYGVSIFGVYLLGNAFSGDSKVTEVTIGDAFIPLLVLLPMVFLPPAWGVIATVIVFGAIYLGARIVLRDWREANNYVLAIGIFFLTVWLMAGITSYVAKGLGTQGWWPGSVNVLEQNQKQGAANTAKAREALCQQGEKEYCESAPTTAASSRPPVIPQNLIPSGMDADQAQKLLAKFCQQRGELFGLRGVFQALPFAVPDQYKGYINDTFCKQLQAYQSTQDTAPAADDKGMLEAGLTLFVTGKLPPGWEGVSASDIAAITSKAQEIRKYLCESGAEPTGWSSLSQPVKDAAKGAAGEACKKAPPAAPSTTQQPAARATPTPAPTAKPTPTPIDCVKKYGKGWYWDARSASRGGDGCVH